MLLCDLILELLLADYTALSQTYQPVALVRPNQPLWFITTHTLFMHKTAAKPIRDSNITKNFYCSWHVDSCMVLRYLIHTYTHTHTHVSQIQHLSDDSLIWHGSKSKHHKNKNDITNITDMIHK